MSKANKNSAFSGVLGEEVTVRKSRGIVSFRNKPRPAVRQLTDKLIASRARFLEATQYAVRQIANEESKALYAKGISKTMTTPYLVAMTDYMLPPKVHEIDALGYKGNVGDAIVVKATDDFEVTSVNIQILDASGAVIEEGETALDQQRVNLWVYKATVANPSRTGTTIKATAYDRPGNKGTLSVTL